MTDPNIQPQVEPAAEAEQQPKNAWDSVIDAVVDEATGEYVLRTQEDVAPESGTDEPETGTIASDTTPEEQPPTDQGDPALRAWATQVSQERAELRRKIEAIEKRQLDADAALDADGFVQRVAAALPEDMGVVLGDRTNFAKVVTKVASTLADQRTKSLRETVEAQQEALTGMGRALEFAVALSPEWAELQPLVAQAAEAYAAQNGGARLTDHFSTSDILQAARAYRDGQKKQQTAPAQATTAKGQAPPPPSAAQAQREARPAPSKAAQAAGEAGYAVHDRDLQNVGRARATGPKAFQRNAASIIDDVLDNIGAAA